MTSVIITKTIVLLLLSSLCFLDAFFVITTHPKHRQWTIQLHLHEPCITDENAFFAKNITRLQSNDLGSFISRRRVLDKAAISLALISNDAKAAYLPAESASFPTGLLQARVTENVLAAPPYGMEGPDVYYPAWFGGTWKVQSKTIQVLAPCGVLLFGGNNTFNAALKDVDRVLTYESRFVLQSNNYSIADREYNVKSIAKAAIGPNSVVDIPFVSPNKITCVLAPPGAPSLLQVDLFTIGRRQEDLSDTQFDCSEVVREIVAPIAGQGQASSDRPRLLKEIETTSLYVYDPTTDQITCRQRSAAFLLPSQQNSIALKLWEASRGRAVDVRYYDVVYTRK